MACSTPRPAARVITTTSHHADSACENAVRRSAASDRRLSERQDQRPAPRRPATGRRGTRAGWRDRRTRTTIAHPGPEQRAAAARTPPRGRPAPRGCARRRAGRRALTRSGAPAAGRGRGGSPRRGRRGRRPRPSPDVRSRAAGGAVERRRPAARAPAGAPVHASHTPSPAHNPASRATRHGSAFTRKRSTALRAAEARHRPDARRPHAQRPA